VIKAWLDSELRAGSQGQGILEYGKNELLVANSSMSIMNRNVFPTLALSGLSITGFILGGTQAAKVEPGASVTYFASAGEGDKWSGKAPIEKIDLEFDPGKPLETSFKAVVRPDKFDSGNGIRDANARGNVFQTGDFPEITLTSTAVAGEAKRLPVGEARNFKVKAKLNLHGVTREIDLNVKAVWNGAKLTATSSFKINLSDYKVGRPQMFFISVDDPVRLEINLEAKPN
jgi:polyisoprenoid-binding protein YceI